MSLTDKKTLIPVSVIGANEKMAHVLDYFFKHSGREHCELVDEQQAQIIILDIDSIEGKKIIQQPPDAYKNKHLILLSVRNPERKGAIYVQKPVKTTELLDAIDTIKASLPEPDEETARKHQNPSAEDVAGEKPENPAPTAPAQPVQQSATPIKQPAPRDRKTGTDSNLADIQQQHSTAKPPKKNKAVKKLSRVDKDATAGNDDKTRPSKYDQLIGPALDINPDVPGQVESREYNPEEYFQNYFHSIVMDAKRQKKAVRLNISDGSIVALPDANTAFTDITEFRLRALSSKPLSEKALTIFLLNDKQLKKFSEHATSLSVYCLLWKSAIWASRGRFPIGTNLFSPVHFQDWSEVTDKILLFRHADRIADLWNKEPLSLLETAKTLDIPQRYVFTFYSACHAIGVASTSSNGKHLQDFGNNKRLKLIIS